jgi:hypothetical protein
VVSLWEVRPGDLVELEGRLLAEAVGATEDGRWLPVVYREAAQPADRWLVGTFDLIEASEVVALLTDRRN